MRGLRETGMNTKGESSSRLGLVSVAHLNLAVSGSEPRPVGRSLAKAAVDQERQTQTKPTTQLGPLFPSPSRPRQLKSIFPSLLLLSFPDFLLISFSLPDVRVLRLLPHRRPIPKHQWLRAKWFKSLSS
jgi:hypothetical protein